MVANLGKWRGRSPSEEEWDKLRRCRCPACAANKIDGLKADKISGFCNRATHNLWVLLDEIRWLEKHLGANTYANNYRRRLDNSTYLTSHYADSQDEEARWKTLSKEKGPASPASAKLIEPPSADFLSAKPTSQ